MNSKYHPNRRARQRLSQAGDLPIRSLTLTKGSNGTSVKLIYNSGLKTLVMEKTGSPARKMLSQCDSWTFDLYNRVPKITSTNIQFYGSTNRAGQFETAVETITA